eukprot:IDg7290t1
MNRTTVIVAHRARVPHQGVIGTWFSGLSGGQPCDTLESQRSSQAERPCAFNPVNAKPCRLLTQVKLPDEK